MLFMKKLLALLCASWSVPAGAAYVPNATEQAVLEAVLRDEVVSFSTGGHSFVGESQGIVPVTAASASQAMAARDRNARMPELKQPLLLSGALAATGSVAGQGEWFDFADTAAPKVRARLAPGQTLAGKPKAGQALALVCGKMDLAKDTLSFSGCEPAAAVAEREAARLKNALAAFYQGKPTDAKVATLAINISLYAQELPAGSGCPGDEARCGASIAAVKLPSLGHKNAVLQRLREAGVDLSAFSPRQQPLFGH